MPDDEATKALAAVLQQAIARALEPPAPRATSTESWPTSQATFSRIGRGFIATKAQVGRKTIPLLPTTSHDRHGSSPTRGSITCSGGGKSWLVGTYKPSAGKG
jgi:hypothetical protein